MTAPENTEASTVSTARASTPSPLGVPGSPSPLGVPGSPRSASSPSVPGPPSVPIACSLTSADLAAQASRWLRLAARAMTGRDETATGVRLSFRAGPGVERELRELAAVESECCGWASWAVAPAGEQVVLEVRSAGDGVAALHGMLTGLRSAPEAG